MESKNISLDEKLQQIEDNNEKLMTQSSEEIRQEKKKYTWSHLSETILEFIK